MATEFPISLRAYIQVAFLCCRVKDDPSSYPAALIACRTCFLLLSAERRILSEKSWDMRSSLNVRTAIT